jgi:hypothetical protein
MIKSTNGSFVKTFDQSAAQSVAAWGSELVRNTTLSAITAGVFLNPSGFRGEASAGEICTVSAITKSTNQRNYSGVFCALEQVKRITHEVFAGPFKCLEREDAEIDNDRHFTFRVVDNGELGDILDRYNLWHERLSEVPASLRSAFRLSIDTRK